MSKLEWKGPGERITEKKTQLRGMGIFVLFQPTELAVRTPDFPSGGCLDVGSLAVKHGQKHDYKNVSILC